MTLEELSIRLSADIAPLAAALSQAESLLTAAGAQADNLAANFYAAGANAGQGLANGLTAQRGAVVAAAQALADAAAGALREALDIHSPSKVTFAVGELFDEGLLRGIQGSAGRVEKAAGSLGDSAADALRMPEITLPEASVQAGRRAEPDAETLLSQLSITVPLEIDGYRLGVAAIEGINRVSQGTGRVELTL